MDIIKRLLSIANASCDVLVPALLITMLLAPIFSKIETVKAADTGWIYAHNEDGSVISVCEAVWADARTNGGSVENLSYFGTAMSVDYSGKAECYQVVRSFFKFDTSSIPDDATVTGVTVEIYGFSAAGPAISIQKGTHGDGTLTTADFTAYSGTYYDTIDPWAVGTYNSFTLNAQGKSDVNKTGFTYYCVRNYNNDYSDRSGDNQWAGCYFSEETGVSKDPRIKVTYTPVSNDPINSAPYPANESIDIPLIPNTLNITVNDPNGDTMNITFRTNESGSWQDADTNSSVSNGTYYCMNTSWIDSVDTKYYWSVNTSDGNGNWDNDTYSFTTVLPPSITINFAGNQSDLGGPYWIPPNENISSGGPYADDGYYTNNSYQQESWIYINSTITDATHAYLRWYDVNTSTWDNTTPLINTAGNYWEVNTSGNLTLTANHKFTFRINASGAGGDKIVYWNKTGMDDIITQRYVHLNCGVSVDLTYQPLYFYRAEIQSALGSGDYVDRGNFDHPVMYVGATSNDTGLLKRSINPDSNETIYCTIFYGAFYGDAGCTIPFVWNNTYFHTWTNTTDGAWDYHGIRTTRRQCSYGGTPSLPENNKLNISAIETDKSHLYINHGQDGVFDYGEDFYLQTGLIEMGTTYSITDNNAYEMLYIGDAVDTNSNNPILYSNRSVSSFVIPNVPTNIWDGTDNSTDTDSDGLSDHMELNTTYGTHTNPFLADTDNDGVSDYDEYMSGSDPNNYTSTIAYYTVPTVDYKIPINGSTGVAISGGVTCYAYTNDTDGNTLNVTWATNESGSWINKHTNTSIVANTIPFYTFTDFDTCNTKYWWKVYVNDGTTNISEVYHFTTKVDTTPPVITINFAGNLSDSGGPYWRPPGELTQLAGAWSDGYYANDSCQHEDWIYINLTVTDSESTVANVWLQWLNETMWTNYTYAFNHVGNYWEYNTSGNIQTCEGYNYSFNIVANDTAENSKTVWWNKTVIGGGQHRRSVQLNCTPVAINYTILYLYHPYTMTTNDYSKYDRLHHDQGPNNGINDTGLYLADIPTDIFSFIECAAFVGAFIDESLCIEDTTIDNIYQHIWWDDDDNECPITYGVSREDIEGGKTKTINSSTAKSNITISGTPVDDKYRLESSLLTQSMVDLPNYNITDNSLYEITGTFINGGNIAMISNRSYTSFIIPNVPDNATLNASHADTDGDGLSDWAELYVTYTNPFITDTDNDGVNDYDESLSGSDPNNYTDTTPYTPSNTAPTITSEIPANTSTGISVTPTCNVTVNDANGDNMNVTFASNYSGSWTNYQTNSTVGNGSYSWSFTGASSYSTKYWWKVYCNDGTENVSEWYYFTTKSIIWQNINTEINGTFTNSTTWQNINTDINGAFTNTTNWHDISTSINGEFTNITSWKVISDTINGSFDNILGWTVIDDTKNGEFSDTTVWKDISTNINGTFINSTSWRIISESINGAFTNTTAWHSISDSINGSFDNLLEWSDISISIDGAFTNTTSWKVISDSINGEFTNTTVWKDISTTINGSFTNSTSWKVIDDSINGSFDNILEWSIIDDAINGAFNALLSWHDIDTSINGNFQNTTTWQDISTAINGEFTNVTTWKEISTTINGTFHNSTAWKVISDSINGSFDNLLNWQNIDVSINGAFTNTTAWKDISTSINGDFTNTTTWKVLSDAINGEFTNVTTWQVIDDSINGSFNQFLTWQTISNTINGIFVNTIQWQVISESINGSFINTTSWKVISISINGSFSNVTQWQTISNIINGTFVNVTSWKDIDISINGDFTNTTSWKIISDNINGSFSNTLAWQNINVEINGEFTNTTTWKTIFNIINGEFTNTTTWQIINSDINGAFTNVTLWHSINTEINGEFTNITVSRIISEAINGSFHNQTSWKNIDTSINGTFHNLMTWQNIDNSINGNFQNTTTWKDISTNINGQFTNTTSWHTINNEINGTFYYTSTWQVISVAINGSFSNTIGWQNIDTSINGTFRDITTWKDIDSSINGSFQHILAWEIISDNINGTFSSTLAWQDIDTSINGTFLSIISWKDINTEINGSFVNTTSWRNIDESINGSFSHVSTWHDLSTSIDGTFINTTVWHIVSEIINGTFLNSTSWHNIDTSFNGTFSNTMIWQTISEDINGSFSSTISWQDISTAINGTLSNVTSWKDISTTINGTFTNITSWKTIDTSINGIFTNATSWKVISEFVNGSFVSTISWQNIDISLNGEFVNSTTWKLISSEINGNFSNAIGWQTISETINGSFLNTMIWQNIDVSVNGSFHNSTSWKIISDSINGNFYNSLSWKDISTIINGSFINVITWHIINDNINGSFDNILSWQDISTTINGSFSNVTTWRVISSEITGSFASTISWKNIQTNINGAFTNSTSWHDIDTIIDGTFSSLLSWKDINTSFNGEFISTISWYDISVEVNGTFSDTIVWQNISNIINGTFVNVMAWQDINNSINGEFTSLLSWQDISININGAFTNAMIWKIIDDTINGGFTNTTIWHIINNSINGSFYNILTWYDISTDINGEFVNTTLWKDISISINGEFLNTTTWHDIDTSINGTMGNWTDYWHIINADINGLFSNTSVWPIPNFDIDVEGSNIHVIDDSTNPHNIEEYMWNITDEEGNEGSTGWVSDTDNLDHLFTFPESGHYMITYWIKYDGNKTAWIMKGTEKLIPLVDKYEPERYSSIKSCKDADYYWYNDSCHRNPETLPWNEKPDRPPAGQHDEYIIQIGEWNVDLRYLFAFVAAIVVLYFLFKRRGEHGLIEAKVNTLIKRKEGKDE